MPLSLHSPNSSTATMLIGDMLSFCGITPRQETTASNSAPAAARQMVRKAPLFHNP